MDWSNVLERAVWTGIQTPAAIALIDFFDAGATTLPPSTLLVGAVIGFTLSAVKSVAQDRLAYLRKSQ